MGGSDKSRLMCCVYCRLSGKQHQMSCFSQCSAATYSGELDEFLILWCENWSWFCIPKII